MDLKVEANLLGTISRFGGMTLRAGCFKEKKIQDKKLLTIELTFCDIGECKTMVLVLDKNMTTKNHPIIYEEIVK
jgi:hypothetical protein